MERADATERRKTAGSFDKLLSAGYSWVSEPNEAIFFV